MHRNSFFTNRARIERSKKLNKFYEYEIDGRFCIFNISKRAYYYLIENKILDQNKIVGLRPKIADEKIQI